VGGIVSYRARHGERARAAREGGGAEAEGGAGTGRGGIGARDRLGGGGQGGWWGPPWRGARRSVRGKRREGGEGEGGHSPRGRRAEGG